MDDAAIIQEEMGHYDGSEDCEGEDAAAAASDYLLPLDAASINHDGDEEEVLLLSPLPLSRHSSPSSPLPPGQVQWVAFFVLVVSASMLQAVDSFWKKGKCGGEEEKGGHAVISPWSAVVSMLMYAAFVVALDMGARVNAKDDLCLVWVSIAVMDTVVLGGRAVEGISSLPLSPSSSSFAATILPYAGLWIAWLTNDLILLHAQSIALEKRMGGAEGGRDSVVHYETFAVVAAAVVVDFAADMAAGHVMSVEFVFLYLNMKITVIILETVVGGGGGRHHHQHQQEEEEEGRCAKAGGALYLLVLCTEQFFLAYAQASSEGDGQHSGDEGGMGKAYVGIFFAGFELVLCSILCGLHCLRLRGNDR